MAVANMTSVELQTADARRSNEGVQDAEVAVYVLLSGEAFLGTGLPASKVKATANNALQPVCGLVLDGNALDDSGLCGFG